MKSNLPFPNFRERKSDGRLPLGEKVLTPVVESLSPTKNTKKYGKVVLSLDPMETILLLKWLPRP
jgi:hypothetical protein